LENAMHMGSTLVVVADRTAGRYLLRDRPGAPLFELIELRLSAEVGEERRHLSRSRGKGGSPHQTEPRPLAIDTREDGFLLQVLRRTIDVYRAERSARLVMCAPAEDLIVLRDGLTADLREHLALSLGTDLTKETPAAIDARLRDLHV
jgi:hypothetical protein